MKTVISFEIDTNKLTGYSDDYLAKLWYIVQANNADIIDEEAGEVAEHVGREIIRRWIDDEPVPLWDHQGKHAPALRNAVIAAV